MPRVQRNFIKGRMNKGVDERLVPNGEYVDALNVRLGSTEGTEIGAVENSKGNEELVSLEFKGAPLSSEAKCIGAFEDGGEETMYWFVTDPANTSSATNKVDLIVSYNTRTFVLVYHVISTSVLNFDKQFLVTGVNKIGDLLFFTDNLNPPRKINVTRTYLSPDNADVDQVTEQDIGVILAPPLNAPEISQYNIGGGENFMEEILISFAYRWQYEDGEYSALSPFTQYAFTPGPFQFDYQTYNQEGMRNIFNTVDVTFETGGRNVIDVDVCFKFSTSQSVNVIERFNKVNEGWLDNTEQTITFTNKKIYTTLPEEQLLRLYDNVPLKAQAQTIMGNRLMYGNYVDGFDIVNTDGAPIYLDYDLELISEELSADEIIATLSDQSYTIDVPTTITNAKFTIDFGGDQVVLEEGAQIGFNFNYIHAAFGGDTANYVNGSEPLNSFEDTFLFVLQRDYTDVFDLATSPEFQDAISSFVPIADNPCFPAFGGTDPQGTSLTDIFTCGVVTQAGYEKIGFGVNANPQGFQIIANQGSTEITIVIPAMQYQLYDPVTGQPVTPVEIVYEYLQCVSAEGLYAQDSSKKSLHSNRDYEVGVVYMDEYGRSSTALVDTENTVFVPCDRSITKNNIRVTLNSYPPYWATKYKFVIKESKGLYRTIYSNIFFREEETGDAYYLLDGDNRDKVKDNDTLFLKRDTNGPVLNCTSTKVLGFGSEAQDFLCTKDANGNAISGVCGQPTGTYMKLKPGNFAANKPPNAFIEEEGKGGDSYPRALVSCSLENEDFDSAAPIAPGNLPYEDWDVPAGSIIRIRFGASRRRRGSKCGSVKYEYDKSFVSSNDYDNLHSWFVGDNIDFTNGILSGSDSSIPGLNQYEDIKPYPTAPCLATLNPQIPCANVPNLGPRRFEYYFGFQRSDIATGGDNRLYLIFDSGVPKCNAPDQRGSYNSVLIEVERASTLTVFETEPLDANDELYYENEQTFDIVNGYHLSGDAAADQDQNATQPAIVDLTFFNCFAFGNGVEENFVLSGLTKPYVQLGEKVTSVSEEEFQEAKRFADITYSGVFNQETNLNKLNQFNLALSNFKTLETDFGPIRKMHARQTDILTLQEDKISYVLVGKNLLSDAAAGGAITSVPEVLGTQLARIEEYGISNNPESFTAYGYDVFFTDSKRSSVIQLKGGTAKTDQLNVISQVGMRSWFRDLFIDAFETQKLGGFDPYMNEYVLSSNTTLKPQPPIEQNCGYTLDINGRNNPYEILVDYETLIGDVEFTVTTNVELNILVLWPTQDLNNPNIDVDIAPGTTTVSWAGEGGTEKDEAYPTQALYVITPNIQVGDPDAVYTIDFPCIEVENITVKKILINFAGDVNQTTQIRYRWSSGATVSPYSSDSIILENDGVSLFSESTGPQSLGTLPVDGATILMQNIQGAGQTFEFDPTKDKFKYLASNTNYDEADLNTLLPLLNTATPIVTTNLTNEATFVYNPPAGQKYLYLLWDFREPTAIDLCYSATSIDDSCCDCGVLLPKYIDSSEWLTATAVYEDSDLLTKSADGYYQAIGYYRFQQNGLLGPAFVCEECGIPCGGTINPPTGDDGLYQLEFAAGTDPNDTGAILIHFNPQSLPDGIRVLYDGVYYNRLSSPTDGNIQSTSGISDAFTFMGDVSDACLPAAPDTSDYTFYDSFNGAWNVGNPSPQSATINFGDYVGGGENEYSVMVIPKPNRLPGLVTLEVLGPCANTGWDVEVECPAELPSFLGQDLGAAGTSCGSTPQTYYFARFRGDNNPRPILNNPVFTDPNGQNRALDQNYRMDDGNIITVTFGVVSNIQPCT